MKILNFDGLNIFFQKIKSIFIQSITGGSGIPLTPDASGNVVIDNVETANNLTAPDAQSSTGTFTYRTSGGTASLTSGPAELVYIDGNSIVTGRIPENWDITTEYDLALEITNASAWRQEITSNSTCIFSYTKPASSAATSSWTAAGTWNLTKDGTTLVDPINLATYGITADNIINPSLSVATTSATITGVTIVPNTWFSQINLSGYYTFSYTIPDDPEDPSAQPYWSDQNGNIITLATYGITITGEASNNDIISVTAEIGTADGSVQIVYTAYNPGTIYNSHPVSFRATGLNQFDKTAMVLENCAIDNGAIVSSSGKYVCYARAVGGLNTGYCAQDCVAVGGTGHIESIGWCSSTPQIGSVVDTTGANGVTNIMANILFANDGYVAVTITDAASLDTLMIYPKWSNTDGFDYEDYTVSILTLPTTDINAQALPYVTYGMPRVGARADRLLLDLKQYEKNIERIEYSDSALRQIIEYGYDYDYDNSYIYYVRPNPVRYTLALDTPSKYTVNDWGCEYFTFSGTPVPATVLVLYAQNLRDKLRTDVLTISQQKLELSDRTSIAQNFGWGQQYNWSSGNRRAIAPKSVSVDDYSFYGDFIASEAVTMDNTGVTLANSIFYVTATLTNGTTTKTISDSRIKANMFVAGCYFSDPTKVTSTNIGWTTANGSITLTYTVSATTTIQFALLYGKAITA